MREMGPGYLQMHVARLTFSQFGVRAMTCSPLQVTGQSWLAASLRPVSGVFRPHLYLT